MKRARCPDTSSTSGTASGPTPTPMRLRAWWTTCMSGASDFAATATAYFRDLQARLCAAFEAFEPVSRFEARSWTKPEGHRLHGGGEARLMRGEGFEKGGAHGESFRAPGAAEPALPVPQPLLVRWRLRSHPDLCVRGRHRGVSWRG